MIAEQSMYQVLQNMNVSYISVGHRPSLLKYHEDLLILGRDGQTPRMKKVQEIEEGNFMQELMNQESFE